MGAAKSIFTLEIFRFFKDLGKHNKKTWMDANRGRYQEVVSKPFRRLLQEVSPALLALDPKFDVMARSGGNFSRINRDIRFAKDKTPYHPHMYLKVAVPLPGEMEGGELYVGIAADTATAGFRIYAMPKQAVSDRVGGRAKAGVESALASTAEKAAGREVRELLVCVSERKLDEERRLADAGRLAAAPGVDCTQEIVQVCRDERVAAR